VPEPLHPAIVHFPIALAVFVPVAALAAAASIRAGWLPARAWWGVATLQILLVGSAYAAVETGEAQAERVAALVGEEAVHEHEEAGERLFLLAGLVMIPAASGLLPGAGGSLARWATVAASGLVLWAGVMVGASGGELVYRRGAANVYLEANDER